MVDSVQSEMVWSSLATVRAVAAELRPVTGKTGCGAILANTSDESKSRRSARPRRSR